MSHPTRKNEGASIPRFGGWDEKGAANYSVVFSRARDKRKQCKSDAMCNIANDHDDLAAASSAQKHGGDPKKNKLLTCINCCMKP
ncbi:hypothetical protein V6N13_145129 [Hibiscus sabdariffa]|uniref:RIN4 pathogenic type III effector avirulence factor Avr cleavage site domain-containing protein n=1 Tax=Hibiscus sabdariffa TaxID=183260 RepID=A0ABR2FME6_9ROSI